MWSTGGEKRKFVSCDWYIYWQFLSKTSVLNRQSMNTCTRTLPADRNNAVCESTLDTFRLFLVLSFAQPCFTSTPSCLWVRQPAVYKKYTWMKEKWWLTERQLYTILWKNVYEIPKVLQVIRVTNWVTIKTNNQTFEILLHRSNIPYWPITTINTWCNCATQSCTDCSSLNVKMSFGSFLLCLMFEEEEKDVWLKTDQDNLTESLVIDFYQMFDVEKLFLEFFALPLPCLIVRHLWI